jgi:tRNA(Ile)-lysidine synthase
MSLRPTIVIVDHQLQSGSNDVAAQAAQVAASLGLTDVRVIPVDVRAEGGDGLESAARAARYDALRRVCSDVSARGILVAHTLEDQAETVLLRLARGSGTRAIAAMKSVSGDIWRPLLGVPRATVAASLEHYGIEPFVDPHNFDSRFLRSRVRHELMPILREVLGADIEIGLARSARLAAEDADALDAAAQQILEYSVDAQGLGVEGLGPIPAAITKRVIRQWLLDSGVSAAGLTAIHIEAVDRLARDPSVHGPVTVVGGVTVHKASGRLRLLN